MKFLIDECLSPTLADMARHRGFSESTHATWLGLKSGSDWSITRRAVLDGYVIVTNNTTDFVALYAHEMLHAGLVCLNVRTGTMRQRLQRRLFQVALDELGTSEPYNEVLEVTASGSNDVLTSRYALSKS